MSLSVLNNVSALTAENAITQTSNNLSSSLQKLSTGLQINSGADGPAALVISNAQQAQITGLQTAINNSNQAVSLVQTGDGALNEISTLLNQIRGLAVSSANSGVNDASALAANQNQISNALNTINQISGDTSFNGRQLFNGSAGYSGTTTSTSVSFLNANSTAAAGNNAIVVSSAATKANFTAATALPATLGQAENLTINGVQVSLTSGETKANVVSAINNVESQTGVTATTNAAGDLQLYSSAYGSASSFTVSSNVAAGATSTGIGTTATTYTGTDIVGTIDGNSATGVGNVLSGSGIAVQINAGTTGTSADDFTSATGSLGNVNITNNSLVFQIGSNAGQTASVAFGTVNTNSIGLAAAGSNAANLQAINVTTSSGAQSAILTVDQAISDVSNLQGTLGAFQANTLTANTANLQTALQNTTSANSTIDDTNYASEIANYSQLQVQLQAGASALSDATQIPQVIEKLLQSQ
jgi:flagellin